MKNIIVNLRKESDLYEKYNNEVSSNLIKYLLNESKTKDDIEIIVNTKLDIENIDKLIRDGLREIYVNTKIIDKFYNSKKMRFFILGVIFLIISGLMGYELLKEFLLIIGWFAICEMIEIILNIDNKIRTKRKIVKKLLNCKIKINIIK